MIEKIESGFVLYSKGSTEYITEWDNQGKFIYTSIPWQCFPCQSDLELWEMERAKNDTLLVSN